MTRKLEDTETNRSFDVTNELKKIGHQVQRTDRVSYRRDQDAFVGSRYPAISEEPEE